MITVTHGSSSIAIGPLVIDTGAARTLVNIDDVESVGVVASRGGHLAGARGIGGRDVAFTFTLDRVALDKATIDHFEVHVGSFRYGNDICGLLGMDFLGASRAVLSFADWTIDFEPAVQSAG